MRIRDPRKESFKDANAKDAKIAEAKKASTKATLASKPSAPTRTVSQAYAEKLGGGKKFTTASKREQDRLERIRIRRAKRQERARAQAARQKQ